MGNSSTPLPSLGTPSGSGRESGPPIVALVIGAVAVVVVLGLLIAFSRQGREHGGPVAADPYASSLSISGPAMSTADNFAGQQVTYIEGKITNNGNKTVNGAQVQIVFHDSLGQVVQKEPQLLMVITSREPYIDTAPLSRVPLPPGQTRDFRLTFEHVSADWNMQLPEITVLTTSTQ